MKDELRTLKDIPATWKCRPEIRKEAVKRANNFKEKREIARKEVDFETYWFFNGKLDEVMEANDLTEEDLK